MKNTLKIIVLLLLGGVFGVDPNEVKSVSVMEGDPVTLHTDITEIQKNYQIDWRFKKADSIKLLVQVSENKEEYQSSVDVSLRNRLQIDIQTGDLTIRNMRMKYSGLYEVEINNPKSSYKRFNVTVKESSCVFIASEVKSVSVKEGESVTLHTDVKIQKGDLILWGFGPDGVLIAKNDMEDNKMSSIVSDERFRDRLKLDDQTGNLTITSAKTEDTGVYKLKISSNKETKFKTFSVSVSGAGLSSVAVAGIILVCLFLLTYAICACLVACLHFHLYKKQKVQERFVEEGESLTLPAVGIKIFRLPDIIEWMYGDKEIIAKINRKDNIPFTYNGANERFNSTLELNNETGDLTINDLKIQHSGLYKVKGTPWPLSKICTSYCLFNVTVTARIKPVKYGDSVTLDTGVTKLQKDDLILWTCGDEDTHIAKFIGGTERPLYFNYHNNDDRFKDRLDTNHDTGSLTIKDITLQHCGVYTALICSNKKSTYKRFKVSIIVQAEKGKSVDLKTGAQIQKDDRVEWSFRDDPLKRTSYDNITLVTGVNGDRNETKYPSMRFKGRLKMNAQTGDLNIRDIRETDEGVYTLQLINTNGKNIQWIFSVVIGMSSENKPRKLSDVPTLEDLYAVVKYVTLGGSLVLHYTVSEYTGDEIEWSFKDEVILTGKLGKKLISEYKGVDERFKDIQLNHFTGDLIIMIANKQHAGVYKMKIKGKQLPISPQFIVTVEERLYEDLTKMGEDSDHYVNLEDIGNNSGTDEFQEGDHFL